MAGDGAVPAERSGPVGSLQLPRSSGALCLWACSLSLVGSTPALTAGEDESDAEGRGLTLRRLEERGEKHQSGRGRGSVEISTERLAVLWN